MLFELKDYQLVNGGQTINTIFQYLQFSNDENKTIKLRQASVLVRIFKVSDSVSDLNMVSQISKKEKGPLKNRIAEYTNSQNSINPQDLKSISSLQILIQQYLEQKDIEYIRKAGIEQSHNQCSNRITMEQLTKILYSCMGHPERVTNQKRKLFSDYYESIFVINEKGFDFDGAFEKILRYFDLRKKYTSYTEQRLYFILYVVYNYKVDDEFANKMINDTLMDYNYTYPARALIQKGFKDNLDKKISSHLTTV